MRTTPFTISRTLSIFLTLFLLIQFFYFVPPVKQVYADTPKVYIVLPWDNEAYITDTDWRSIQHVTFDSRLHDKTPNNDISAIMQSSFRNQLLDSNGHVFKVTGFNESDRFYYESANGTLTTNRDYTLQYWANEIATYGDDFDSGWHYHFMKWSDPNGDDVYHWNQYTDISDNDQEETLARMLQESTGWFPSFWRTGWVWENDQLSNWLEKWIPYDFTNESPSVATDDTEPYSGIEDWSRATIEWIPYHPSSSDYQVSGSQNRYVARSVTINANNLEGEIEKGFLSTEGWKMKIPTDEACTYQPIAHWHTLSDNTKYSNTTNAYVEFWFYGTSVIWLTAKGPTSGIAGVYIDDVFQENVDLYSSVSQNPRVGYITRGLSDGPHKLKIVVTGTKNASSTGYLIDIKKFGVLGDNELQATRYEETDSSITYVGTWSSANDANYSGGSAKSNGTASSTATFSFTGTGVQFLGFKNAFRGIAKIYIDNVYQQEVDTYDTTSLYKPVIYSKYDLTNEAHTLTVEVTGTKNASSSGTSITIDAFKAFSPTTTTDVATSTILSFYLHPANDMDNLYNNLFSRINNVLAKFPSVHWEWATAKEAMQGYLGLSDLSSPSISISKNQNTYTISSNEAIWQSQPFVSVKYLDGTIQRVDTINTGTNQWQLTATSVDTIAVGVSDVAGNSTLAKYQAVPSYPTILTPTVLSSNSIRWNFTDNADNETGFRLYDSQGNLISTQATPNLSYIDETGLSANTQYTRYVKAYNAYGESASSSAVSIYTLVDIPTGFNFMRHPNSLELYVDSFPNDHSGLSGYLFWRTDNSSYNSGWIQTNTWQDPNMVEGQTYTYAVKYRNGDGVETATTTLAGVCFISSVGGGGTPIIQPQTTGSTTTQQATTTSTTSTAATSTITISKPSPTSSSQAQQAVLQHIQIQIVEIQKKLIVLISQLIQLLQEQLRVQLQSR